MHDFSVPFPGSSDVSVAPKPQVFPIVQPNAQQIAAANAAGVSLKKEPPKKPVEVRAHRCENCAFRYSAEHKKGNPGISGPEYGVKPLVIEQCRLNPPPWPSIEPNFWCGQWELNETTPFSATEKEAKEINLKLLSEAKRAGLEGVDCIESATCEMCQKKTKVFCLGTPNVLKWFCVECATKYTTEKPNANLQNAESVNAGVGENIRKRGRPKKESKEVQKGKEGSADH